MVHARHARPDKRWVVRVATEAGPDAVPPEVLTSTYDAIASDLFESVIRAYGTGPWQPGIERSIQSVFDFVEEDPEGIRFACLILPAGCKALSVHRERARARWAAVFLAHCHSHPGAEDVTLLHVEFTVGAVHHTVERHLREHRQSELHGLAPGISAAFLPPVRRPGPMP